VRPLWHRALVFVVPLGLGSCSEASHEVSLPLPPFDDFIPLSSALGIRCGSLDCHGQVGRNLRLYSQFGLRESAEDIPAGDETTVEEHEANHMAVISLEPEQLSLVWLNDGRGSLSLSLVSKARGREAHKGGAVFLAGSAGDRCLLSWLSGSLDAVACEEVSEAPPSPFAD
jgi:hypothetical protein